MLMHLLKCYCGVYFPCCFTTWVINIVITLLWVHNFAYLFIHNVWTGVANCYSLPLQSLHYPLFMSSWQDHIYLCIMYGLEWQTVYSLPLQSIHYPLFVSSWQCYVCMLCCLFVFWKVNFGYGYIKPRSHMYCNLSTTALWLKNCCNQCNHCAIKNCVFWLQINRWLLGDNYP